MEFLLILSLGECGQNDIGLLRYTCLFQGGGELVPVQSLYKVFLSQFGTQILDPFLQAVFEEKLGTQAVHSNNV